eukprot:scaffold27646_cov42-Attheya_sp.AAC.1
MLSRWGAAGRVGVMARRNNVRGVSSAASSSSLVQSARLERTLYRQLIKWCRVAGWNVPLDAIPPVTLIPPRIDAQALHSFSQKRENANQDDDDMLYMNDLLPPGSVVEDGKMVLPVRHVRDIERVIRLAYRLNHPSHTEPMTTHTSSSSSSTIRQDRVSLAFDAMKSLNQLTDALDQKKKSRSQHMDRTGVPYFVGQGRISYAYASKIDRNDGTY